MNNKKVNQPCPQCNFPIGIVAGTKNAICQNCGFKDACCQPQYDPLIVEELGREEQIV